MKIAYFDCFSGAAGDMIVASLIDAGADKAKLTDSLRSLKVTGFDLAAEKIQKQGLAATRFSVALSAADQPHRHLRHVLEIINGSGISNDAKEKSARIFTRLAQAEATVHQTTIEKVHFHEVGAVDAIVDVVGAMLALELLGIERICCSPIPVGSGTTPCQHGIIPVPAPATVELLKGVPIAPCDEPGELITPTGAAILTTLAEGFGPLPAMTISSIGYGAGTREGKTRPNVLRVFVGDSDESAQQGLERIVLLETNVDDATPQMIAHCAQRLLDAGASDVWTQPIQMKKQRSGLLLSVLCPVAKIGLLEEIIFTETPTLGIRRHYLERKVLARHVEEVATQFGTIRMKVRVFKGTRSATPEFDDCQAAAAKYGVPLQKIMDEASAAWNASGSAAAG